MADGTIRETLVLDYAQALGAVRGVAEESQRAAVAQRELEQSARVSEVALRRLEDLAVGSASERAALAYQRQAAEIRRLGEVTGDHALAARAMAQLDAEAARRLSVSTTATQGLARAHAESAAAAERSVASHGQLTAGMANLGSQAADVAAQLAAGTSPALILVQQGPQIAGAVTQIGGLGAALSAVGSAAVAAAPYLAAAAVALGALGAGWAVLSNVTTTAASEAREANAALIAQASAAQPTAQEVQRLAEAWQGYLDIADDVRSKIAVINGELDAGEAAAAKAAARVDDAARVTLVAQGQEVARLRVALTAAEAEIEATRGRERADAQGVAQGLREQLAAAQERLDATKAQVSSTREQAAAEAEYGVELKKSEDVLRERERRAREAARQAEEDARRRADAERRLAAEMLDFARVQGEGMFSRDAGAQEGLAYLRMVREEMDGAFGADRANAMALLTEGIAKWPEYAEAFRTIIEETSVPDARRTLEQSAATAAGVVGYVSSGPEATMGAIATATGPIGALVVGIIQAVVNFDDTIKAFGSYLDQLWTSVARLPEMLMGAIEDGMLLGMVDMVKGLVGFVQSLADNLDGLLMGVVESIPEVTGAVIQALVLDLPSAIHDLVRAILSPRLWRDMIVELWRGLGEVIRGAFTDIAEMLRRSWMEFVEALRDLFTVFDEGLFPQGGPSSAGDLAGDVFLGPNRSGVLVDLYQGPQGEGGVRGVATGIAGLFSSERSNGARRAAVRRMGGQVRAGGPVINAGFVFGGQAGIREIAELVQRDAAISRYGWAV